MEYQPWRPETDSQNLRVMGKCLEELGELTAALSRCIIQGIHEREPVTLKPNIEWLEEEIADVQVNLSLLIERFNLDTSRMTDRMCEKKPKLQRWQNEAL